MESRRVVLYGSSLILGTVSASLRRYPDLEVLSLSPPFPSPEELSALAPDVILFDVETGRPEAVFSLLGTCPSLVLIGIDPDTNQALLWSGRYLRELSTQDLVRVIHQDQPGTSDRPEGNHIGA